MVVGVDGFVIAAVPAMVAGLETEGAPTFFG